MIGTILIRRAIFALLALSSITWLQTATAATISFKVPLSAAEQVPPLSSAGKGTAVLTWDPSTRVLTWNITDSGLTGPVTMAHFHNGPKGKNGPVVIWLTKKGEATAGSIEGKATLTPAQVKEFEAGDWYINVHTKDHPGGEIRGQVKPPKS
jgi:CHRD domain